MSYDFLVKFLYNPAKYKKMIDKFISLNYYFEKAKFEPFIMFSDVL